MLSYQGSTVITYHYNFFRVVLYKNADKSVDERLTVKLSQRFGRIYAFCCQSATFTCCYNCKFHCYLCLLCFSSFSSLHQEVFQAGDDAVGHRFIHGVICPPLTAEPHSLTTYFPSWHDILGYAITYHGHFVCGKM